MFNSGAAAAYASSFRPWQPTGRFKDVKSTFAQEMFRDIQRVNFEQEMALARQALVEGSAIKRQGMVNDATLEALDKRLDAEKDAFKKEAFLGLINPSGGGGSGGGGSDVAAQLLSKYVSSDPVASAMAKIRQTQGFESLVESQMADVSEAAKAAIEDAPAPNRSGKPSSLRLKGTKSGQASQLQTPELSSVELDDEWFESTLQSVRKRFLTTPQTESTK